MGDVPTETETTETKTTELPVVSPPWMDPARKRAFVDAFRRGDRRGLIATYYDDPKAIPSPVELMLADTLLEVRRANVAVLGQADVFVRRTDHGDLEQVIAPVTLSMADGTLYQIPDRWEKQVRGQPGVLWTYRKHKELAYDFVPVIQEPTRASVSAEGFLRMNAIAGCSVVLPPTVWVDGVEKMNPAVLRDDDGDVVRVVISVRVAGPAPLTGNLVLVQYVLDMDPRVDLLHMLAALVGGKKQWVPDKAPETTEEQDAAAEEERAAVAAAAAAAAPVKLMSRQDYNDWRRELGDERIRWHWIRLHGPIGYAHDLTHQSVQRAYTKYLGIVQNIVKKAQTIARRNAMKSHPALARHAVVLSADRTATVPVTGWTARGADLGRYTRALDDLARSGRVDVIDAGEVYDPGQHATGDAELDPTAPPMDADPERAVAAPPVSGKGLLQRNELLEELDVVAMGVRGSRLAELGYPPEPTATLEQLAQMLAALREVRS